MKAGKSVAAVNWIFNAWGEKYEELMADTRIACLINDDLKMECFLPGIVMEGGSIDVNGCGTVLTTEQCLLNRNRNPSLNKEEIESYLREFLGVQQGHLAEGGHRRGRHGRACGRHCQVRESDHGSMRLRGRS